MNRTWESENQPSISKYIQMDSTHTHAGNIMLKISLQKNKIKMHKKSKIKKIPINAEKTSPK